MIEVPETIDGSFYRGDVFVGLKENSFEPSSPLRHMTELNQILFNQSDSNPIILLYTDGGPDHRLTYVSVKLSLVALFLERDLDFLCAVRTPPHHSWKNPVERIMSIINIALQSVGMMRSKTQNYEEELKSCKTTAAIRELGSKYPGVKQEVLDAVEPAKVLLYDLIKRLKLKDKPFSTFFAVIEKDMDDLWEKLQTIDSTLLRSDTTQKSISSKVNIQDFFNTHCKITHYMFSVKKCGSDSCQWCQKPRLPGEVFQNLHHLPDPTPQGEKYLDFQSLYGTDTSEKFRPSLSQSEQKSHGMPFSPSAQYARNVGVVLQCDECQKWRVIYSKTVLNAEQKNELELVIESLTYTCGSRMQEIEGSLTGLVEKVYVRANLTCLSPIEIPYYSAKYEDICYHCGTTEELVISESNYPICSSCILANKATVPRRKRNFAPKEK